MKTNVNFYAFTEAFKAMRPDNFSYTGLRILFDYLEQLEEDMGEEMELDVIAICCDYSEYATLEELQADYDEDEDTLCDYIINGCIEEGQPIIIQAH